MKKITSISILLASSLIILFLLSGVGLLGFSFTGILYLMLIVAGIGLVYTGILNKSDFIVFGGTILFLIGILLLTNLNLNLSLERNAYMPIVLLISSIGFVMLYINTPSRKIYLLIFLLLLVTSTILLITQSTISPDLFIESTLKVINVYWPAIVIFALLVFLLRKEK